MMEPTVASVVEHLRAGHVRIAASVVGDLSPSQMMLVVQRVVETLFLAGDGDLIPGFVEKLRGSSGHDGWYTHESFEKALALAESGSPSVATMPPDAPAHAREPMPGTITQPLYHFTDSRNIDSILRLGLLSLRQMTNRGVAYVQASTALSHAIDRRKCLDNYIRLALRDTHPMASAALHYGRIRTIAWLAVHHQVAARRGVQFSNTNAASNAATINGDPATALGGDGQAEILVPTHIARVHIAVHQVT